MDEERNWYPYESGTTIGKRGPASGRILRDEEWGDADEPEDADARVTLETLTEGGFSVTANLYGGWLQETARFADARFADEENASQAYTKAMAELSGLAEFIPDEDERDMAGAIEKLNGAVASFVAQFGGAPTV